MCKEDVGLVAGNAQTGVTFHDGVRGSDIQLTIVPPIHDNVGSRRVGNRFHNEMLQAPEKVHRQVGRRHHRAFCRTLRMREMLTPMTLWQLILHIPVTSCFNAVALVYPKASTALWAAVHETGRMSLCFLHGAGKEVSKIVDSPSLGCFIRGCATGGLRAGVLFEDVPSD